MIPAISPRCVVRAAAFLLLSIAPLRAEVQTKPEGLTQFTSKAGNFGIRLPGTPQYEKTTVGEAKEPQHQFKVGGKSGVYLISYQENPNLKGSTPEELDAALESGRDRLLQVFQGELIDSSRVELESSQPGLSFRLTIPRANGLARCRFYLVGTRLYQILAMGIPDFVDSSQTTQVIESFQLLP